MENQERYKHHNERLVRFFLEKAYNDNVTIDQLIDDNILSGTKLAEMAVSNATGIKKDLIGLGMDLKDGSDVKTVTVSFRDNCHRAVVNKITKKVGMLRIIAYNPNIDWWFYFKIPYRIHKNNSRLSITFDKTTGEPIGKYAKYKIDSWEEFCRR